ncbi:hypothetical protein J6590_101932, partial [Homalodisca vitripennis]
EIDEAAVLSKLLTQCPAPAASQQTKLLSANNCRLWCMFGAVRRHTSGILLAE